MGMAVKGSVEHGVIKKALQLLVSREFFDTHGGDLGLDQFQLDAIERLTIRADKALERLAARKAARDARREQRTGEETV